MTLEKTYQPHSIESKWSKIWEAEHFATTTTGTKDPFSILLPPPNVTGRLHMGHGFQQSLMDTLVRYHKMQGHPTHWQMGLDHAGIATQMVVERQLLTDGQSRHDLGRENFIDRIWRWKQASGGYIEQQMRRFGVAADWSLSRFTMDEASVRAVTRAFVELYREKLIYRGKRLVNWDPKLHTAISDLEVVSEEEAGYLWHIQYPLLAPSNGCTHLTVATTRPETLLGDAAVAVHPDDERYQHLIGQALQLPLTDRTISVIADPYVDPEFGSGCVKITPAHDFNDYEIGKRHNLPQYNILNDDATLNETVPAAYQGLDRFAARQKIIEDLTAAGVLEKTEPHKLMVPRGDRSGVILEPYLTDQWYVSTAPLAKPAIEAVHQGDLRFVPENWSKTYLQWLENIEDWCISRQLWWGHRIPAWYDAQGAVYVGMDLEDVRAHYHLAETCVLTQDDDVLDTWFSSALWPFSTLGWPEKTPMLHQFYPSSVLVTGFDIIFFWVARMVMLGLKFMRKVPFNEVYITGLIRDAEGQKMSKSKGNVLDPIDLIDGIELSALKEKRTQGLMQPQMAEKIKKQTAKDFPEGIPAFGTDAVRFTFCALASTGRDVRFDLNRVAGYRNFCNKLWNAARFVLMNAEDFQHDPNTPMVLGTAEHWIQSKLQHLIENVHKHIRHYRFDLLCQALYEFAWNEYCDWYLELTKPVLYDETIDPAIKQGTRHTLLSVLETLMRLMHPVMPYITEEIWQRVAPRLNIHSDVLLQQTFPQQTPATIQPEAEQNIDWVKQVVMGIRTIRSEMNLSPAKALPVLLQKGSELDKTRSHDMQRFLFSLAKLESLHWLEDGAVAPAAATTLVGDLEVLIPIENLIDVAAESVRLEKAISKHEKEFLAASKKLDNPNYVSKAPAEVVAKEQAKQQQAQDAMQKLRSQLATLAGLQQP